MYTSHWDQTTWEQNALTTWVGEKRRMGRTDILQTLSSTVKLSENKCKVVHLEWSYPMWRDRLGIRCAKESQSADQTKTETTECPCWLEIRQPDSPRYAQWQMQQAEKKAIASKILIKYIEGNILHRDGSQELESWNKWNIHPSYKFSNLMHLIEEFSNLMHLLCFSHPNNFYGIFLTFCFSKL